MHPPFAEEYAMWGSMEPSVKAVNAEYETEIHFQKCYGVMTELFEANDNLNSLLPRSGFRFLDLGCAPGGFSSFMLEDPRCEMGFGVTLPSSCGGFPVRVRSSNFFLQQADLFEIGPTDLLASEVHVCVCDAQYLRNNISWDEKYRGVRCRSKQHGVWALLLKQFWLGLSRLLAGGILIFRFGWRDPGPEDPATIWYKKMTLRLFSLLTDLFGQVKEIKSDYFNALQSSFYVCCSQFKRERFVEREVAKLLGVTVNYLLSTSIEDSNELDILPQADRLRTEEVDQRISDMLDRIQKIRLVHEQSRKRHQQQEVVREDPRAVLVLAPAPPGLGDEELTAALAVYGRVLRVERQGQQVSAQFAMLEHARSAVATLRTSRAFGDNVRIWIREEEEVGTANDFWTKEWPRAGAGKATWAPKESRAAAPMEAAASPPGFTPQPRGGAPAPGAARAAARREAAPPQQQPQPQQQQQQQQQPPPPPPRQQPQQPRQQQQQQQQPRAPAARARDAAPATGQRAAMAQPQASPASVPAAGARPAAAGEQQARGTTPPTTAPIRSEGAATPEPAKAVGDKVACKPSLHPVLQDKQARTRELIAEMLKSK